MIARGNESFSTSDAAKVRKKPPLFVPSRLQIINMTTDFIVGARFTALTILFNIAAVIRKTLAVLHIALRHTNICHAHTHAAFREQMFGDISVVNSTYDKKEALLGVLQMKGSKDNNIQLVNV